MKKIILFLAIVLSLAATSSFAQNGQRMQEAWKSYLKDSVQFSDAMVDSVLAIRTQYQPQMREIFMDQSASAEDKQAKMKTLRDEMDVRYKGAGLTDDQIKQIHDHEAALRQRMMERRNNGGR